MNIDYMSEEEFNDFKTETLHRLAQIAKAEGHPMIAYTLKDGWVTLTDLVTGEEAYGRP